MNNALNPTLLETIAMRDELFAAYLSAGSDIELLESVITLANEEYHRVTLSGWIV